MKSAGLIGLLIWGRRYISGPLDGVVYAALIAGGFAFTENILYFAQSFHQAQAAGEVAGFWQTFFLRGILSPFAHVSFTALCGLGLGIAAERRSLMLYFGLGVGGLSSGMVLHALWNGSTFFIPVDPEAPLAGFLRYYASVQVPSSCCWWASCSSCGCGRSASCAGSSPSTAGPAGSPPMRWSC